jgi:hypothetical protein
MNSVELRLSGSRDSQEQCGAALQLDWIGLGDSLASSTQEPARASYRKEPFFPPIFLRIFASIFRLFFRLVFVCVVAGGRFWPCTCGPMVWPVDIGIALLGWVSSNFSSPPFILVTILLSPSDNIPWVCANLVC